jgi:hypothetical protein
VSRPTQVAAIAGVGFRAVIRGDRSELSMAPWPPNEDYRPSTSWGKEVPVLDARHSAERILMHAAHMFALPLAPERNREAEPRPTSRVHAGSRMGTSENTLVRSSANALTPTSSWNKGQAAGPRP